MAFVGSSLVCWDPLVCCLRHLLIFKGASYLMVNGVVAPETRDNAIYTWAFFWLVSNFCQSFVVLVFQMHIILWREQARAFHFVYSLSVQETEAWKSWSCAENSTNKDCFLFKFPVVAFSLPLGTVLMKTDFEIQCKGSIKKNSGL